MRMAQDNGINSNSHIPDFHSFPTMFFLSFVSFNFIVNVNCAEWIECSPYTHTHINKIHSNHNEKKINRGRNMSASQPESKVFCSRYFIPCSWLFKNRLLLSTQKYARQEIQFVVVVLQSHNCFHLVFVFFIYISILCVLLAFLCKNIWN